MKDKEVCVRAWILLMGLRCTLVVCHFGMIQGHTERSMCKELTAACMSRAQLYFEIKNPTNCL